jgi:hypothetical protein
MSHWEGWVLCPYSTESWWRIVGIGVEQADAIMALSIPKNQEHGATSRDIAQARLEPAATVIVDRPPLRLRTALRALVASVVNTARLLTRRAISQPREHVGRVLVFANGTRAPVYRETIVPSDGAERPAVLVVAFKLRWVRGVGHALFRVESLLNTPLFVGFPGFVSKLWLAHDEQGVYRGFYQWNDPELADAYVRALWWVLALVSVRGSIRYAVLPGLQRDEVLSDPTVLDVVMPEERETWWRLRDVALPDR